MSNMQHIDTLTLSPTHTLSLTLFVTISIWHGAVCTPEFVDKIAIVYFRIYLMFPKRQTLKQRKTTRPLNRCEFWTAPRTTWIIAM